MRIFGTGDRLDGRRRATADRGLPEYLGSEISPTRRAFTGKMEDAVGCIGIVDEARCHSPDRQSQVARGCRISPLVTNHPYHFLTARDSKHGGDEIRTARAVEPRRPQNDVSRAGRADRQFTAQFRCAVNVDRVGGIGLRPRTDCLARKNIIGGNMDQRNVGACARLAQRCRGQGIDGPCCHGVGFCGIDRGVGGRVDHGRPVAAADQRCDSSRISEIDDRPVDRMNSPSCWPCAALQRGAKLSARTGDEKGAERAHRHAARPRRRSAPRSATIDRHHAAFSRYQRTVLRNPVSKLSRGAQPSSALMRPASIA